MFVIKNVFLCSIYNRSAFVDKYFAKIKLYAYTSYRSLKTKLNSIVSNEFK